MTPSVLPLGFAKRGLVLAAFATAILLAGTLLTSCGILGPSAGEKDDVGSNTNWFRSCSESADCGDALACICGACSRSCTGAEDCEEGQICPVDRGTYQLACPEQVFDLEASSCRLACDQDADCSFGGLCLAGACVQPDVEACPDASAIAWVTEPGELQARVGSLFGEDFYIPSYFSGGMGAGSGTYLPTELAVQVTDNGGSGISDCDVVLVTEETSGFADAVEPRTDADGRVTLLWVAGSAAEQTMSARVLREDGSWLSVSASGEARRHDEEPLSTDVPPLSSTRPSHLTLAFEPTLASDASVRVAFAPLTFPPRTIYAPLVTSSFEVWFSNAGSISALETDVPAAFRHMWLRASGLDDLSGSVLHWATSDGCSLDGLDMTCLESDAWALGEELSLRVDARHLAVGEVVTDYDFGEPPPCEASIGCTDYEVFVKRADTDFERRAVLRSPTIDDLSSRSAFITGDYAEGAGRAGSCLETERSSFFVAHESATLEDWEPSLGLAVEASPYSYESDICTNYAIFPSGDGYLLTTGGPSPVSTPHLPGVPRSLD